MGCYGHVRSSVPELDGFDQFLNHDAFLLTSQPRQMLFWYSLIAPFASDAIVDLVHVDIFHLPNNMYNTYKHGDPEKPLLHCNHVDACRQVVNDENFTLTLPERQIARMSKITNDGLTRSGTGCFTAIPI